MLAGCSPVEHIPNPKITPANPSPIPSSTSPAGAPLIPTNPPLTPSIAPITIDQLRNTTYISNAVSPGQNITLVGGAYDSGPTGPGGSQRLTIHMLDTVAFGDLDGDGQVEALVLLAANTGGSGTFISLEVVRRNSTGALVHTASQILGDRVQVRNIQIVGEKIQLDMLVHGPQDPLCCASTPALLEFSMQNGVLVDVSQPGTSIQPNNRDLIGVVWQWVKFQDNDAISNLVVDTPERYLLTFLPDGTYQIQADCNHGSGQFIREGNNLQLQPGPMTMMACPENSYDSIFLQYLNSVVTFAIDSQSQLVLALKMNAGEMVFQAQR